jgi:hypothetical protein
LQPKPLGQASSFKNGRTGLPGDQKSCKLYLLILFLQGPQGVKFPAHNEAVYTAIPALACTPCKIDCAIKSGPPPEIDPGFGSCRVWQNNVNHRLVGI